MRAWLMHLPDEGPGPLCGLGTEFCPLLASSLVPQVPRPPYHAPHSGLSQDGCWEGRAMQAEEATAKPDGSQ